MNPLLPIAPEPFKAGTSDLKYFSNRIVKLEYGALLFCISGEAEFTIDLQEHHIFPQTLVVLLPDSILSLTSASKDFRMQFFTFSAEMMRVACLRLEPAFMHFLKGEACYTHPRQEDIDSIRGLLRAVMGVYADREHQFREHIAQNLLQIFFFNAYDKIERFFTKEQVTGGSRKEQLFKKFILLVHLHCVNQRDVAFYADKLCISTRYLSAITQAMGKNTAKEIIDEFLMLEIKVALQSTNLSLKEIAERYKFPDQSFFGRYFKKHTGMSPKEYRTKMM